MKRIGLFLDVKPHAGGMFQYAQSLLEALQALPSQEFEVRIACTSEAWRPILATYRFPVTYLTGGAFGVACANAMMAARIPVVISRLANLFNPVFWQLKMQNCDAWIFPAQDAIAYQLFLPSIATVHDLMHRYEPHFPEVAGKGRFRMREHRFRNLTRYAKAVLTDSEVGKQHVIESYGTPANKIYPLPYIPPKSIFEAKPRDDFDAHYHLPQKFLFYPAQFWAHKNHKALIGAAASVRQECPDLKLVFTGGLAHEYEAVRAHAQSLGMLDAITFCGYVPDADLPGFYSRATALIMPTYFGPTNIPPLEAMACGCAVAVSGIYGMPQQLGNAALYFDQKSVDSMAAAIHTLWSDETLRKQLIDHGYNKIATWNQKSFNQRLRNIFEKSLCGQ